MQQVEPDVLPLVPVYPEHFSHKTIESECTIQDFCIDNNLNTASFNIFLHPPEEMNNHLPHDVILMDKVTVE